MFYSMELLQSLLKMFEKHNLLHLVDFARKTSEHFWAQKPCWRNVWVLFSALRYLFAGVSNPKGEEKYWLSSDEEDYMALGHDKKIRKRFHVLEPISRNIFYYIYYVVSCKLSCLPSNHQNVLSMVEAYCKACI